MNEQEWYLFDLQGYLVVENVLTAAQLDALNAELDRQIAVVNDPDRTWFRWDGLLP
ncbi:phytanoyl-CoA dioxygenase family protein [Thermoleptolyngbya sichuanensis]|nr:phytanoyl-CoA dioxygenase family protein [Thermoleptolyngbya sichuanensis]